MQAPAPKLSGGDDGLALLDTLERIQRGDLLFRDLGIRTLDDRPEHGQVPVTSDLAQAAGGHVFVGALADGLGHRLLEQLGRLEQLREVSEPDQRVSARELGVVHLDVELESLDDPAGVLLQRRLRRRLRSTGPADDALFCQDVELAQLVQQERDVVDRRQMHHEVERDLPRFRHRLFRRDLGSEPLERARVADEAIGPNGQQAVEARLLEVFEEGPRHHVAQEVLNVLRLLASILPVALVAAPHPHLARALAHQRLEETGQRLPWHSQTRLLGSRQHQLSALLVPLRIEPLRFRGRARDGRPDVPVDALAACRLQPAAERAPVDQLEGSVLAKAPWLLEVEAVGRAGQVPFALRYLSLPSLADVLGAQQNPLEPRQGQEGGLGRAQTPEQQLDLCYLQIGADVRGLQDVLEAASASLAVLRP